MPPRDAAQAKSGTSYERGESPECSCARVDALPLPRARIRRGAPSPRLHDERAAHRRGEGRDTDGLVPAHDDGDANLRRPARSRHTRVEWLGAMLPGMKKLA